MKGSAVSYGLPLFFGGLPLGFGLGAIAEGGLYSSVASPFSEAKGEPASEFDLPEVSEIGDILCEMTDRARGF